MNNNLDKTNDIYYTSIVLDNEFKELIYKQIKYAQNVFHAHYLPNLTVYSCYHAPLETYFKQKYNKSPTKPDKLAFLLLLTYPVDIVRNFNSVRDIKLAFKTEHSDFQHYGEKIITKDNMNDYQNEDFDGEIENTCICSKGIRNIFIIQNKYNNITVQVGCDCIEKNGLVSPEEIKKYKKKVEILHEREKERIENKPEGFYENLRQEDKKSKVELKNIKKENKLMMEEDKLSKKTEKLINDELKRLNKKIPGSYLSKKCYFCKSDTIFKNTEKLLLCSKCCPSHQKQKKQRFINSIQNIRECTKCKHYFVNNKGIFVKLCDTCYKLKECVNCEKDFTGQNDLCLECEKVYNMKKCQLCPFNFIVSHKSNDLYCDECDKNLIKCIDCKRDILKNSRNNTRCYTCGIRFVDKITVKECEYCDDEFEVKESEKWKTCCSECYFDNRKLETCQDCNEYFKKMKNETWRTRCGPCYYKNKNKNISVTC